MCCVGWAGAWLEPASLRICHQLGQCHIHNLSQNGSYLIIQLVSLSSCLMRGRVRQLMHKLGTQASQRVVQIDVAWPWCTASGVFADSWHWEHLWSLSVSYLRP